MTTIIEILLIVITLILLDLKGIVYWFCSFDKEFGTVICNFGQGGKYIIEVRKWIFSYDIAATSTNPYIMEGTRVWLKGNRKDGYNINMYITDEDNDENNG